VPPLKKALRRRLGMPPKDIPLWWDTLPPRPPAAAHAWRETADVAIVGAGYTGLAAARILARRGATVVVLEAETPGWGASSRNGGMVLTGLKPEIGALLRRYGLAVARELFATSLAAIETVAELVTQERIDCDFHRPGHLLVAAKASHLAGLTDHARLLQEHFGHPVRIVPRGELRSELGSDLFHGGLIDPSSAALDPARYAAGLLKAAEHAGAEVHQHTRVEHIRREGSRFLLDTPRGSLRAAEVLIATNGYTGAATPALRRRIIPIGSYIIATEPLDPRLAADLIPHRRMVFDTRHYLHYFRLSPDRRLLFGGRAAFFPPGPATLARSAAILRRDLVRVFPQLEAAAIEYAWGGRLGFCFDRLPHFGRLEGLHYALGYAGHGVALATHLGQLAARMLAGEPITHPLAELEFPTAPLGLYRGRPWFLPLAGAWYKLLDWIQ